MRGRRTRSNCSRMQECKSSSISLYLRAYCAALLALVTLAFKCCKCCVNLILTSKGSMAPFFCCLLCFLSRIGTLVSSTLVAMASKSFSVGRGTVSLNGLLPSTAGKGAEEADAVEEYGAGRLAYVV